MKSIMVERPRVGWLTPNRACNNRCNWCYAQSSNFHDKVLSLDLAKKLISLFAELGIQRVLILGGEPTLYRHLKEIIELSIAAGLEPVIVTNGRRFSDWKFAEMMAKSGIEYVGISVKGANKEQYLQLTQSDGYNEMIEGFQNLRKLGIEASFSVTMVEGIIESFDELVQNLIDKGATKISIDMGNPVITKEGVEAINIVDPLELARVIERSYTILEKHGIDYDIFLNTPLCLIDKDILDALLSNDRSVTCCQVHTNSGLIFDQEGRVLACNSMCDLPLGQYGTDFSDKDSFDVFWSSKEMERFRRTMLRYPTKQCVSCKDWEICGGGCPMKWMHWDPKEYITGRRSDND